MLFLHKKNNSLFFALSIALLFALFAPCKLSLAKGAALINKYDFKDADDNHQNEEPANTNPQPSQKTNAKKSFVQSITITADNIEASGESLKQDLRTNKKQSNEKQNKTNQELNIKATSNVVVKTSDGDVINSGKLLVFKADKLAKLAGGVQMTLTSPEVLQNTGGYSVKMESEDLIVRDTIDTFDAQKPYMVLSKEQSSLYLKADNLQRDGNVFTMLNPTISGCSFESCQVKKILPWSFKASAARLNTKTQSLEMNNFRFRLYNVPIFYLPIVKTNIKKEESYVKNQQILLIGNQTGFAFSLKEPNRSKTKGYSITPTIELYATTPINTIMNSVTSKKQTTPTIQQRMHNIGFVIRKDSQNQSSNFKVKYANDFIPNLITQSIASDASKQSRYFVKAEGFYLQNVSFVKKSRIDYSFTDVSDIFFMSKYDNEPMLPYYQNNLKYQVSKSNNAEVSSINATTFTNIQIQKLMTEAQKPATMPNFSYQKTIFGHDLKDVKMPFAMFKFKRQDTLSFDLSSANIFRQDGTSLQRLNAQTSFTRGINVGKYKLFNFNFFTRNTFYNYSGSKNSIQQSFNANNLARKNPSINYADFRLNSSASFIKSTKRAIIILEPKIAIFYNPFTTNKNGVFNEDSATGFLQSFNVFSPSQFTGLDIAEDGFRAALGTEAKITPLQKGLEDTFFVFTIAKRYNNYKSLPVLTNGYLLQDGLSGYLLSGELQSKNFFFKHSQVKDSGMSFNSSNLFTSSELGFRFTYFDFTFNNNHISPKVFNNTIANNITNNTVAIAFKPIKNYSLSLSRTSSSIVQLSTAANQKNNINVVDNISLLYSSKCLNYSLGILKISNTLNPSQPATQFIFSFNVLM